MQSESCTLVLEPLESTPTGKMCNELILETIN